MHTASDFLSVRFPSPKTYTLPSTPHHPVILRGAQGEVAESIIQKITLALRERGGAVADGGRGPVKSTFSHPSSALTRAPSPKGEGFPSLIEIVDSATPGKPCVQNDMRVK